MNFNNPEYFTFSEFFKNLTDCEKNKAMHDKRLCANLCEFVRMLNNVREIFPYPIYINSWYRSDEHNRRVGGVSTSQHLDGSAIDITFKDFGSNVDKFLDALNDSGSFIICGQVIVYKTFIHIGLLNDKYPYPHVSYK